MVIPNPYAPKDTRLTEHIIELFREIKPDFIGKPTGGFNYVDEAIKELSPAQKKQFIADHRHEAERPLDERSRAFMGLLIQLGAKDLDVTNAVDEMFHYLESSADPKDIRRLVKADANLIYYNIHPKNFEQINRFLQREHELLHEWQGLLIEKGIKKKPFRQNPSFAWLKNSRFAEDPIVAAAVAKIEARD